MPVASTVDQTGDTARQCKCALLARTVPCDKEKSQHERNAVVEMSFLGVLDLLRSCGHTLKLGNIVVLLRFGGLHLGQRIRRAAHGWHPAAPGPRRVWLISEMRASAPLPPEVQKATLTVQPRFATAWNQPCRAAFARRSSREVFI